ncbi:Dabb family protein [Shimia sagamensis]|uniref:Stress responsive A/B Barrel Domain n=1 Tax=Shimia sagamensis TaxID=1566352 RepID=A0ABY1NU75_9RHOB|nr:Dabb family protein [Shimia sagamensis]SMP17673.1 Stress responsive A/B Barrel Domain [Shimia sagamensis]
MIRHCVMLNVPAGAQEELKAVLAGLADLVQALDGCCGFAAGPNRDFEGKSPNHPFGFMFDAKDEAALQAYADHPEHKALGAKLVSLCQDGADGIVVYDIEVSA